MPAANAARSAPNRRMASGRETEDLVPVSVLLPLERPHVGFGWEVGAGQAPLAAASFSGEVGGGLGRRSETDGQDEDPGDPAEEAEESFAGNVEDVRDTRTDVVRRRLPRPRLRLWHVLRRCHGLRRSPLLGGLWRGSRVLGGGPRRAGGRSAAPQGHDAGGSGG